MHRLLLLLLLSQQALTGRFLDLDYDINPIDGELSSRALNLIVIYAILIFCYFEFLWFIWPLLLGLGFLLLDGFSWHGALITADGAWYLWWGSCARAECAHRQRGLP